MALVNEVENEDELDQYLVDKIHLAIDQLGEPKYLVAKIYSFKDEFKSLFADLRRKTPPTPKVKGDNWSSIRRGNLYTLNNLVNEWQLTMSHTSFTAKEVYDVCDNIKKSLNKIKSEVYGESSSKDDPEGSVSQHDKKPDRTVSKEDHEGSVSQHDKKPDRKFPKDDPEGPVSQHDKKPDHEIFVRHKGEVHRWSSRFPPRKVLGIEHMMLAMERELVLRNKNAPFKVFGVVGVAGIGKTTLCQAIFGRDPVKERYSPRVWVCLSKQPKDRSDDYQKEIVVRILKCLGIDDEAIDDAVNDEKYGLKKLILLLRLQLIGKRYLIVLDDAWKDHIFFHDLTKGDPLDDTWGESLAYGLPKGCGGTIISSSTSEKLLKKMLGEDIEMQHLKELNDEIIYDILKDAVLEYDEEEKGFPTDLDVADLDVLKNELLKKCAGVPFAAKLLAKIAWTRLGFKPKSQQPKGGDEGSHDIGLPMVRHEQMASTSADNK